MVGAPIIRVVCLVLVLLTLVLSAGCGKKGKGYSYVPSTIHMSISAQMISHR